MKDHDWFSLYATKNRVHGELLANDKPTVVNDCVPLHDEFIILVSCVLVAKLKAFQVFSDVQDHIPHQYSKEMSEKSHIVCIISYFIAIFMIIKI